MKAIIIGHVQCVLRKYYHIAMPAADNIIRSQLPTNSPLDINDLLDTNPNILGTISSKILSFGSQSGILCDALIQESE